MLFTLLKSFWWVLQSYLKFTLRTVQNFVLKFEIPQPDEPFYHVIHYVKQNVTIHWLTASKKLQN